MVPMCGRYASTCFVSFISTTSRRSVEKYLRYGEWVCFASQTVYRLFARFNLWVDRMVCAIAMNNTQYIIDTFLSLPSLLTL